MGANLASSQSELVATLKKALVKLSDAGVMIRAVSRFYKTPAFPAGAGPDYINAAFVARTDWPATQFLDLLHEIESGMGRERVQRWGQRVLDLDMIAVGDAIAPDLATYRDWLDLPLERQMREAPKELILPHPRMHERAFVLIPLADVAPDWVHPVIGKTVQEMRDALPPAQRQEVILVE
jgi:2-amino-4-hydroxy-6-hydroxymethyldihydropteridine diphosphokinase